MINGLPSTTYFASDFAQRDQHRMRKQAAWEYRRDIAERVRLVHEGHFGRYVAESLRATYHPDTFQAMRARIRTSNNVQRDIVAKLAVAWAEGATYKLVDASGNDYADPDGAFAAALAVGQFGALARQLDELTLLHSRAAVGPTVHTQKRTGLRAFSWAVHTPETFDLDTCDDSPGDYEALVTYGERDDHAGVRRRCKTTWASDTITEYVLGSQGRWEVASETANPYRCIPFVLFPAAPSSSDVWLPALGEMLSDVTIEVNCWETFLSYVGAGQVKFLGGEFKGFPPGQVLRHAGALDFGNAENVNVMDMQTDVARLRDVYVNQPRRQAATAVGLQPDAFEVSGSPESGEARKMRNWDRDRQAVFRRAALKQALVELFWMQQHVLAHQLARTQDEDGAPIPPIAGISATVPYDPATYDTKGLSLRIDVNEITYPELAAERAQAEDRDLALGITNPVEIYRRKNPDVSNEEARQQVLANKAITAALSDPSAMRRTAPALLRRLGGAGEPTGG